jgi:hypothetical protein
MGTIHMNLGGAPAGPAGEKIGYKAQVYIAVQHLTQRRLHILMFERIAQSSSKSKVCKVASISNAKWC